MLNASEMEKLSLCAEMGRQCTEALGDLFVGTPLPEKEKPGLIKSIFAPGTAQVRTVPGPLGGMGREGGGLGQVDRDEIFKAEAGRPSKTVARTIQGSGLSAVSAADIKGDGPMAAVAKTKLVSAPIF